MSVSTVIKSIQDIMRQDAGVDGDAQRISQMVWMLFLKIFDDKEQEYEIEDDDYRSPIPENLRWSNWASDSEGITGEELLDFINNDLFKTLKELSFEEGDDPRGFIVREVFEDAYNYMKSGTLIRQVINKINEIDFNRSQDRHLFNDIYEKILKDLQSAGNAGEFYTPRAVTQFIVDMVNPQLGETVLDPACGTGGFLICSLEHLRKQVNNLEEERILQKSVYGTEKKPMPHLLSVTNMILHGIELRNVKRDNSLSSPINAITQKDRVDVIVTNPPFGGTEEDGIETNFPSALQTKETADLFLVLIMRKLKDGGRCGIVLPDGTLFGEGVKNRIKEKLLEECNLHTIVRLPNGVFSPYTGIKTNLLFFTKGEPTQEIWYYEHPYPEGAKSYNKTKPIRIEEFEPEKAWWDHRAESEFAWKYDFEEVRRKAKAEAETHWKRAEEANNQASFYDKSIRQLEEELRNLKNGGDEQLNLFGNQEKIKQKLSELKDDKERQLNLAREEQSRGDSIYWPIFNLDQKNPNKIVEGTGDPVELLAKYKERLAGIHQQRQSLKAELEACLKGATS